MTHEDVNWILRLPCDEIVVTQTTLNRIAAAIASTGQQAEGIKFQDGQDTNGRLTRTPATLAGRKLTLREPTPIDEFYSGVELKTRGCQTAIITIPVP